MKKLLQTIIGNPDIEEVFYKGQKFVRYSSSDRIQNNLPVCILFEAENEKDSITFYQNDFYKIFDIQVGYNYGYSKILSYRRKIKDYKVKNLRKGIDFIVNPDNTFSMFI
jgi:hypothetical protein